jgi:hypothetical protein
MNLISPTELARQIGISKQAVFKSLAEGVIPFELKGKRKFVDLDDQDVKAYIKISSRQREVAKKKEEKPSKKITKSKKSSKKSSKKIAKSKSPSKKSPKKISKSKDKSKKSENEIDFDEMSSFNIKQQTQIAEMRKKQIHVQILEKNFLPREFIEDGLFRYIERLNSNIERSAALFIKEVGQKILDDKEVTPKHIDKFTSMVLGLIDNTKKNIIKAIKKYEPKL